MTKIWPGQPAPLGATWDGKGVNFALFAASAERVELCLFADVAAPHERERLVLPQRTGDVWHGYLPGAKPGLVYGYRVDGPYAPKEGLRFNRFKLLADPYALAIGATDRWDNTLYGYHPGVPNAHLSFDARDSAPVAPRSIVVDQAFDWGKDRPLAIPYDRSLFYEVHVKGFTKLHPDVPEELRGTYAGLAAPAVIAYLKDLGVTAVELLPVQQHFSEPFLTERGLVNYWGYSTLGFFAPDWRYSASGACGGQVAEFKAMVKALHAAGIEVLLDVVYNHTAEGSHEGPTLAYKGIENRAYYRLMRDAPHYTMDFTGCGNTLDLTHPRVLQLVLDSLRYWVQEMHVDGFRFDLASALARGHNDFEQQGVFFAAVAQDPILSRVKLIAEPWDVGVGGYQVGNYPPPWTEWNGRYRDDIRRFWKGDSLPLDAFALRLQGSPDLYAAAHRGPLASVNFITAHDGFTLRDLVSYNTKHNEANQEHNHDGDNHNNSWNCGVEGPTDDPAILTLRARQQRNLLATLLLSQGVPMLLAGDERSRTQHGNNNSYCQDNEINWIDWSLDAAGAALLAFTQRLAKLRAEHPALHRRHFYAADEITWIHSGGSTVADHEQSALVGTIGVLLDGRRLNELDARGQPIRDSVLLLLFNASRYDAGFVLPGVNGDWQPLLDTANDAPPAALPPGEVYPLPALSVALLQAGS